MISNKNTLTILFLSLSSIFSGSLKAEELGACTSLTQNNDKFKKLERAENSGLEIPSNGAVRVTADEIDGTSSTQVVATGNVIVEQLNKTINAPEISYEGNNNLVHTRKNFVLTDETSNITGENLDYNTQTQGGLAQNIHFENTDGQRYQGYAQEAEMFGKNYFRFKDAVLNTCKPGDDSWYIKAKEIDADRTKNVGVAKNATLYFKDIPIFYSPWLDFPLNGNRKSGFLAPTIGGGSDGLKIVLPYYLNLAPNYDATITPVYYSRRGVALHSEFRYLQPKYRGQFNGEWVPKDRLAELNNRYVFRWQHKQKLSDKINMGIDYHQASDVDYYRDLGNRLDSAENTDLNRQFWISHRDELFGGSWYNSLNVQRYQVMRDRNNTLSEQYRLLPRITSQWNKDFGIARVSVLGQFTRFEHKTAQEGTREVLYPTVQFNFSRPWGFVRPKLGLHATAYQIDAWRGKEKYNKTRVLPILSLDSGLIFERDTALWKKDQMVQTLEPRLFYTYIPSKEQNNLPNFDSSENDFSYEQLFRENRFSGYDRINSANQISTALMTRFYEKDTGRERLKLGAGQRFYFKHDDIGLSGKLTSREKNRSDFVAFFVSQLNDKLYMQGDWHYDPKQNRSESYSTAIRYHHDIGKNISLRYGFDRKSLWYADRPDKLEYVDIGFQWPIYRNVSLVARENYSLTHKKSLDQLLGLQYDAKCGCWNAKLVMTRYVTDYDKTKNAFFFQLQFKGLGGLGSSANEELRRAIPGYSFIDMEK